MLRRKFLFCGFQYYVIFVDHCTKHIWLFPLKRKSDVSIVFPKFKRIVEKLFQKPIIYFYSDNGWEFIHLRSFFEAVTFSFFSLYTWTQCYYRASSLLCWGDMYIVIQSNLPLKFCSYAFTIAAYLINRLPTRNLDNDSAYLRLYGTLPNYVSLVVYVILSCVPTIRINYNHT